MWQFFGGPILCQIIFSQFIFFHEYIFSTNTVCQGQSLPLNFAPAEKYSSIFYLFCVDYKGKRGLLKKKADEIISLNMYTVAMDTTTKPFLNFQGTTWLYYRNA